MLPPPLRSGVPGRAVCVLVCAAATLQTAESHGAPGDVAPPKAHIELSVGPVTGTSRVVGLGGAYTSVAEGLDGQAYNPASLGNRLAQARRWWSIDGTAGLSLLPLDGTDYENDGHTNGQIQRQMTTMVGAMLQGDFLGVGWQRRQRSYTVSSPVDEDNRATYTFSEHLLGLGLQVEEMGLAVGMNAVFQSTLIEAYKTGFLGLSSEDLGSSELVGGWGGGGFVGLEFGALYRPRGQPFRVGTSIRVVGEQVPEELDAAALDPDILAAVRSRIPVSVRSTGHWRLGASWQLGRPYNPKRRFKRLHEESWFRRHILRERFPEGGPVPEIEITEPRVEVEFEHADTGVIVSEVPVPEVLPPGEDVEPPPPDPTEARSGIGLLEEWYALFSMDLVVTPAQADTGIPYLGPEGFVVRRFDERGGEHWTLGLHLGAEVEPVPRWLKMRLGTYYEPSRFRDQEGRFHLSGGLDVHFPHLWALEAAGASRNVIDWVGELPLTARIYADGARDYLSIGFSIGIWK